MPKLVHLPLGEYEEIEVAGVVEARDILYRRTCGSCLEEVEHFYINDSGEVISFLPDLRELLATGCGLEWEYKV